MCKYCEETNLISPIYVESDAIDVLAIIDPVRLSSGKRAYQFCVYHAHTDEEARFAINYCPMCGRRLGGEER